MFGDILANLKPQDLRITPGITTLEKSHPMLASGAPSNQQILDATKQFYGKYQPLVDTTTQNANTVASTQKAFVSGLNSQSSALQNKTLTAAAQSQASTGLFGDGGGGGGIFGPTLDKVTASQLFTTIGVGVSAEAMVLVGGLGGIGCAWDIAKREGPKGYGYATLELGLKIAVDINVQVVILNQLPSALNSPIYGLTVGVNVGLGATFTTFFTGMGTNLLGYGIAIGIGGGVGAAVFGGHVWNF